MFLHRPTFVTKPVIARISILALLLVLVTLTLNGKSHGNAGAAGVPNDDFANATAVVTIPQHINMDTFGATLAATDPATSCFADYRASVWFRFTPTVTQAYTMTTVGSLYETLLAIYTGDEGSLHQVKCDEESGPDSFPLMNVPLAAGTTYSILVAGGAAAPVGELSFTVSELDSDLDGVIDSADNCDFNPSPDQADFDGDGRGDPCDFDDDNDSFSDTSERRYGSDPRNPVSVPENNVANSGSCANGVDDDDDGLLDGSDSSCDSDGDGVFDEDDNCPIDSNADQQDFDSDTFGDACDSDDDGDNSSDYDEERFGSDSFNVLSTPEYYGRYEYDSHYGYRQTCEDEVDNDLDGLTDAADPGCEEPPNLDHDRDDVPDAVDNCPTVSNTGQDDLDGDSLGDVCDPDMDGDGFSNSDEITAGSRAGNSSSTPEYLPANPSTCVDGRDNDLDGLTDDADPSCSNSSRSVDFSIGVDLNGDNVDDCGTKPGQPDTCVVELGSRYRLHYYLNELPYQSSVYLGIDFVTVFSGVRPFLGIGSPDWTAWPDCRFQAVFTDPSFLGFGCTIGIFQPPSFHLGRVASLDFSCDASGDVGLLGGFGNTAVTADLEEPAFSEDPTSDDDLQISCLRGAPIPPTPTPMPTSTPPSAQGGGREPSMALQVYGDTAKQQLVCDRGAMERLCPIGSGSTFSVDVHTDAGPPAGYQGYQVVLQYSGNVSFVDQGGLAENRWPYCSGQGVEQGSAPAAAAPGRYVIGCTSSAVRTYEGPLANVHFACKGNGTGLISIVGGAGALVSFYHKPSINGNRIFLVADPEGGQQLADAIVVRCGSDGGTSGADTDGDRCGDVREAGTNERAGGRRDALNPWDFFDPTGDGKHRIDDVLLVVDSYFADEGGASYSMEVDRTLLGPNAWNLGPPDGRVRIDDVVNMVKQYFHDCS